MSRFFCSDCTILRFFSGLLGRFGLPDHLPFSKPKVNWLLHPVMVLFLSVYSYGTIIAYPYIYLIYNLLFFLSESSRAHSFVAFEECAEMGLVPEAELVGYLLYGHRRRDKKCFGALHECAFDKRTGRNAECLFDRVSHITRGEAKLVGVPIE